MKITKTKRTIIEKQVLLEEDEAKGIKDALNEILTDWRFKTSISTRGRRLLRSFKKAL